MPLICNYEYGNVVLEYFFFANFTFGAVKLKIDQEIS